MKEAPYFSSQTIKDGESNQTRINTTARTVSTTNEDIALSCIFDVPKRISLGLVFGCTDDQRQQLIKRLRRVRPESDAHPTLVPGIFFELERARLEECVDELLDNFALKPSEDRALDLDMGKLEMVDYLKSCYRSREQGSQIRSLKRQLRKVAREITSIEEMLLKKNKKKQKQKTEVSSTPGHSDQLIRAGRRIKARLWEMCDTLDNKTDNCNIMIETMSLTMQTLWNHLAREDNRLNIHFSRVNTDLASTNEKVSQTMQNDSSQMKYIALLTMVFLPISTMASIFSTTLFSWDAGPGEPVVSRYFWVFVVISLGLTTLVVGAWGVATRYAKRKLASGKAGDIEMEDKRSPPLRGDWDPFGSRDGS
ncbi:hypothetical protein G7054_g10782 [Neopestalotiopsis clavispora]|nr:hypothetical protein G7054_g10782 [Neopestalotiopsis clavispora]